MRGGSTDQALVGSNGGIKCGSCMSRTNSVEDDDDEEVVCSSDEC